MTYDFSKLKGRVYEKGLNITKLADQCELSRSSIIKKFNGERQFKTEDITKICKALDIEGEDIHIYFFTENVSEFEQLESECTKKEKGGDTDDE